MNRTKHALAALLLAFSAIAPATSLANECPPYPEDVKGMVVGEFMRELLVRDAGIFQDGCDLKLVLVVNSATTEEYARDLGDRFVRLTKGLGPGPGPEKQIGKGIYNYLVGVFTPGEDRLALGAKVAEAVKLTW